MAVDAYRALRVRDYGRVDLRLTETGEIYVLEVNASCYLEKSSEFAIGRRGRGLDYPRLIERIVEPGVGADGEEAAGRAARDVDAVAYGKVRLPRVDVVHRQRRSPAS